MPVSLEEQILDCIQTKLVAGLVGVTVHRPPVALAEFNVEDLPAVVIRRGKKEQSQHLRGATEMLLQVDLMCEVETDDDTNSALQELIRAVRVLVQTNRKWNNGTDLARRTVILDDSEHEMETPEDKLSGFVTIGILARSDRNDPTAVKAI